MNSKKWRYLTVLLAVAIVISAIASVAAEEPANGNFEQTWARTDQPVATGQATRTWMWGPEAFTGAMNEPYDESPGGQRDVQYFDKARMEITNPGGDPNSVWYVTNGLLVVELITGRMQVGDDRFEDREPAEINVAGDADDPTGPTYATFMPLLDTAPLPDGSTITQQIDRSGAVTDDPALANYGVTVGHIDDVTNHAIAGPFWEFMNSSGTVYEDGTLTNGLLFENPFFATGRPITEAYWSTVQVGGTYTLVLMQCFERRCLTYTPDNTEGWQVEAGNVGRHYYQWRYDATSPSQPEPTATSPAPTPTQPPPTPEPTPTAPPDDDFVTFGGGMQIVGEDIPAGTYRSSSADGCYWERVSGFSGELDDIIANNFADHRQVVTIEPSDAGFNSERCGTWTSDLSPITTSPTAPFSDGTWIVGTDIAPGTWRNDDSSDDCYWERLSGFGGTLDDIISNEFTDQLQVVTIRPGDEGFTSSRCGTWTRIGD